MLYPNPRETSEAIRKHLESFGYPALALRDPEHILVKVATATVTPEAGVFDRQRRIVYRGRIDDRFVAVGTERRTPTRHDLEQAILATLVGRALVPTSTRAVGCFITDLVP